MKEHPHGPKRTNKKPLKWKDPFKIKKNKNESSRSRRGKHCNKHTHVAKKDHVCTTTTVAQRGESKGKKCTAQ
jgi:hypothetical protein